MLITSDSKDYSGSMNEEQLKSAVLYVSIIFCHMDIKWQVAHWHNVPFYDIEMLQKLTFKLPIEYNNAVSILLRNKQVIKGLNTCTDKVRKYTSGTNAYKITKNLECCSLLGYIYIKNKYRLILHFPLVSIITIPLSKFKSRTVGDFMVSMN